MSALSYPGKSPIPGTPRSHRAPSVDIAPSAGAPFEDLRRRLATINGSSNSLVTPPTSAAPRDPRPTTSMLSHPNKVPIMSPEVAVLQHRPGSPTESVLSTSGSAILRTTVRGLHMASFDQKAAPAVGSSKTNATGLLEAASRIRSEGSPERSGRSSPTSLSGGGTLRGVPPPRPRALSLLPISSYGTQINFHISPFEPPLRPGLDGMEPGVIHLLEHMYLDGSKDLQGDFGPKIHEGPIRRRTTVRHSFVSRDATHKRPEANLIAHLSPHTDAITGLAVSPDHMFFVSASDDKTVKVWDTARLERNVTSKPRHSYSQHHAKVKCVCTLEGVHCFASAAEDGSIHVVRVNVNQTGTLPKYGKLQALREHRLEHLGEYATCMIHFNSGMFHLPIFPRATATPFFLTTDVDLFYSVGFVPIGVRCTFVYASIRCCI